MFLFFYLITGKVIIWLSNLKTWIRQYQIHHYYLPKRPISTWQNDHNWESFVWLQIILDWSWLCGIVYHFTTHLIITIKTSEYFLHSMLYVLSCPGKIFAKQARRSREKAQRAFEWRSRLVEHLWQGGHENNSIVGDIFSVHGNHHKNFPDAGAGGALYSSSLKSWPYFHLHAAGNISF